MATIYINDLTHRAACCDGTAADDVAVYDANAERILAVIAEKAKAAGHELVVRPNASGAASYSVEAEERADEEAAHDFMQGPDADFWRWL